MADEDLYPPIPKTRGQLTQERRRWDAFNKKWAQARAERIANEDDADYLARWANAGVIEALKGADDE